MQLISCMTSCDAPALRAVARMSAKLLHNRVFRGSEDRNPNEINGRGDRIRTCDIYVPNVALYQSELHPGVNSNAKLPGFAGRAASPKRQESEAR